MTLTLRILGLELIALEVSTEQPGAGDYLSNPVGFVRDAGGSEWEAGVER